MIEDNLKADPNFFDKSSEKIEKKNCNRDYTAAIKWAMSFDGYSDRMTSGLINDTLICAGITDPTCHTSTSGVRNTRIKITAVVREEHSKNELKVPCLAFDGKRSVNALPHNKTIQEENVTVQNGITGKFVGLLKPKDGSGKTLAGELHDLCIKKNYDDSFKICHTLRRVSRIFFQFSLCFLCFFLNILQFD